MENIAFYNGEVNSAEKMKIPFCDRVCFFGDGVYDACYSRNKKVFTLDEHIDRLYKSAALTDIKIPMQKGELTKTVESLVKESNNGQHFVYIQITRGTGIRNHLYSQMTGNVWISVMPKCITPQTALLKTISVPDRRYSFCNIKTLNLLPNVLAAQQASVAGCDEAIFHTDGIVHECAHSNVHLLKDHVLYTSPCDEKILEGIARRHLLKACKFLGIEVREEKFTLADIEDCDELYITSAGTFCAPVISCDGKPCGRKSLSVTTAIQEYLYSEFADATR